MIENLVVCGDSFNAVSPLPEYKGTHWSEILSSRLNLKLINLADQGSSLTRITFQLLESLNIPNSFVICGPTIGLNRLETLVDSKFGATSVHSLSDFKPQTNSSSYYSEDGFLKSIKPDDGDYEVLAKYLNSFMVVHQGKWGYLYALKKLKDKNIPMLVLEGFSFLSWKFIDKEEYMEYNISLDELVLLEDFNPFKGFIDRFNPKHKMFRDPGYHTIPEKQLVIAEYFYQRIKDRIK